MSIEIIHGMIGELLLIEQEVIDEKWKIVDYHYIVKVNPTPIALLVTT